MAKVGILALQGAFIEHKKTLESLGAECVEIRQKKDLKDLNGIVLPGGESTVQGQLLHKLDLFQPIRDKILSGLPVLATCAGLILLAQSIEGGSESHLGTLPVTVRRNAYGRQLGSFAGAYPMKGYGQFPMVFIRAPYIAETSPQVDVLASVDGHPVAVRYENQIGLSFHPELSPDTRIHETFLQLCEA